MALPKVIAGTKILAKLWNQMVDFLQDTTVGHAHSGATNDGHTIAHADLTPATGHPHAGTGKSDTVDWHMDASGGSADHALHGALLHWFLPPVYGDSQLFFEVGTVATTKRNADDKCGGNPDPTYYVLLTTHLATVVGALGWFGSPDLAEDSIGYPTDYWGGSPYIFVGDGEKHRFYVHNCNPGDDTILTFDPLAVNQVLYIKRLDDDNKSGNPVLHYLIWGTR